MREPAVIRLGEACEKIGSGATPLGGSSVYQDAGIALIRSQNVYNDGFHRDGLAFISDGHADELSNVEVQSGDVLLNITGDSVARVCQVPDDVLPARVNQHVAIIRPAADKLDARYLRYFLTSPVTQDYMLALAAAGATRNALTKGMIEDFEVPARPLDEQRAIAGVLGALDDKIELNRRMNETLEAIAQAQFRRMMEEGEPGTFGDIAENPKRGVDPSEVDPQTPYIGLEHMPRRCIALSEWGAAGDVGSGKARFHRGEILFGKLRPYFHKVGVAPLDGVCSTDILTIVPKKPVWFGLVLGHLSSKELIDHSDACSTGTKMPRASWLDIAGYEIALPSETVAGALTGKVQPLVERIIANIHESRTLAALRDALLPACSADRPKLLSGAVRVKEREVDTPD